MKRMLLTLAALLPLTLPVSAEEMDGVFTAKIRVRATGHSFDGAVTSEAFRVSVTKKEIEGKTEEFISFSATAKMAKLTTYDHERDAKMLEHFKADKSPDITGKVREYPLATLMQGTSLKPVKMQFLLYFAGAKAPLMAEISDTKKHPDGRIEFDAYFRVSQKEFGVEPISMAMVMSVRDEVPVKAHFVLTPAKP